MRAFRLLMTLFTVVGLCVLVSFPWFVGARPTGTEGLVAYSARFAIYVVLLSVSFFLAAIFAVLLAREIRKEYREQSLKNLADLLTNFPSSRKSEDTEGDHR